MFFPSEDILRISQSRSFLFVPLLYLDESLKLSLLEMFPSTHPFPPLAAAAALAAARPPWVERQLPMLMSIELAVAAVVAKYEDDESSSSRSRLNHP